MKTSTAFSRHTEFESAAHERVSAPARTSHAARRDETGDVPMGAYLWSMMLRAPGSLEQMENA